MDTCKVENMMDILADRDLVENGLDSPECDTSDCGTVGAMIFLKLWYLDACSK